jgi:hypothetical protein|tara:strand:- start:237 stop:530 length:294 start_codon:yes stop_codon:yes gene_type:complete
MNNINIKYVVPVGSRLTRKFYCPMLKKEIALTEDFTEEEITFNSNHLTKVDSGINFSYFRFTVGATNYEDQPIIKKFDVCYSVSAEYIEIKKEVINN